MTRTGWAILIAWLVLFVVLDVWIPSLIRAANLSFLTKFAPITQSLMTMTLALWGSQALVALSRPVIWLLAATGRLTGDQWKSYSSDIKLVHSVSLWALGIMTAITVYLAQWFS